MAKRVDGNNHIEDGHQVAGISDGFIPENARPLCPKCFVPCEPLAYYCDKCDSNDTINPLASYMPFERIRFNAGMYGKVWRRLWGGKDTSIALKIFYLFIIVMGATVLLIVGLPLRFISKIENLSLQKTVTIAFYILLFALLATYLFFV